MATYQSSQTSTFAASSSVVLTKPTSLAVGDLLVAALSNAATSGTPGSFTVPSGWTEQSNLVSAGVSSNLVRLQILTKVADSSDVAASNFTFTVSGHAGFVAGGLSRISNMGAVSGNANKTQNDSTSSPITFTGFTPTRTDNLLMMFATTYGTAGSIGAFSGYSVTTDNPTWTERYDLNNGSNRAALAMATGPRTGANATGTVSISATLPTDADTLVVLLALSDTVNGSITVGEQKVAAYAFSPIPTLEIEAVAGTPTVDISNPSTWTNPDKPTTTWTNTPKP